MKQRTAFLPVASPSPPSRWCWVTPAGAFVYWFWSYLDRHRVRPPFDTGLFLSMA